jgi:hypothetical protein
MPMPAAAPATGAPMRAAAPITSRPSPDRQFVPRPPSKRPFRPKSSKEKQPPQILFQQYFKSVGPRTYAAQVMKYSNGNHGLVLTEGKRDEKTDEVRKTKLFIFGEDFDAFFDLLRDAAKFIRANPVPEEIMKKRDAMWKKQQAKGAKSSKPNAG